MLSTRTTNNEICNDENLKADHTGDGVLLTSQTGQVRERARAGPAAWPPPSQPRTLQPSAAIRHIRPTGVVLLLPGVTCVLLCVFLGVTVRSTWGSSRCG
jgi:hypothetical protein